MAEQTKAERYRKRWAALRNERSSHEGHWRDLADMFMPRRPRFLLSERNRGNRRNTRVINSVGIIAARTAASGIQAGFTSPARPWFRLSLSNPIMMADRGARIWLDEVEQILRYVFAKSNLYTSTHELYGDLDTFGTGPLLIERHDEDVIRCTVPPCGSYCVAPGPDGRIDTMYREVALTVDQIARRWGADYVKARSKRIASALAENRLDEPIELMHVIEPNASRVNGRGDYRGMPWSSCWFEQATDERQVLHEGGFEEQPFMCPRWSVRAEDVYGTSPAMDCLGDVRQIQAMERRAAQVQELITNPPMNSPNTGKLEPRSTLPGANNYYDAGMPTAKYEPAVQPDVRAMMVRDEIYRVEQRVNSAMYATLFLLLTSTGRDNMTAREVEERHEEKILQLGPVIDRMQDELADPMIARVYGILLREGMLPDPPESLMGQAWEVEYISVLAQAQKLLGTIGLERLLQFSTALYQIQPESIDKLNVDRLIESYAESLGTPANIIESDRVVAEKRMARARTVTPEAVKDTAAGVKSVSGPVDDTSALNRMLAAAGAGQVSA